MTNKEEIILEKKENYKDKIFTQDFIFDSKNKNVQKAVVDIKQWFPNYEEKNISVISHIITSIRIGDQYFDYSEKPICLLCETSKNNENKDSSKNFMCENEIVFRYSADKMRDDIRFEYFIRKSPLFFFYLIKIENAKIFEKNPDITIQISTKLKIREFKNSCNQDKNQKV